MHEQNFSFEAAVELMRRGRKVTRKGWDNGVLSMEIVGDKSYLWFNFGAPDQMMYVYKNPKSSLDYTGLWAKALAAAGWRVIEDVYETGWMVLDDEVPQSDSEN